MTDIVSENVTKPTFTNKYNQDKTPEHSFSERALFVFNIYYDTTEAELKDVFLRFGPAKVKLMMNENATKNRGHAFVEYQDPAHAKEAVKQLNGYALHETKIKVQFNTKQPPWYSGSYHSSRKHIDNPPSNSVYVRNLDNTITTEDLEAHFARFGPVKVSLVIDHVTKRNKGYAFVDFSTIDEATSAIKQTNGVMFFGRQLHVEFSNRGSNLDSRKSESVSSLNSDLDETEASKLRHNREQMEDDLTEKKTELDEAKASGSEDAIQSVREHIWRLQDDIARIKLSEEYPQSTGRSRSREEKRKKKRRSDEGDNYYSDEREQTPGTERSYTPTSFGSRRSHHRGSISSNSSQGDDGYLEHRVFVGGINHMTTPETFKAVFSKFGKISSYFLKWDKTTGRNKGFGFVSYDTAEQMESLLASHKDSPLVIDNHVVNIKRVFPESYVSPFPLNIPPMLCRSAPHFTDSPPYCDERNPLPEDRKIVEFFYNLGIHHYNLLRINVYHWNLLFPGNTLSSAKMDSAPSTRQPSPAPPSFPCPTTPAPPTLPVFPTLDQQHRPTGHATPMMQGPLPAHRNMYQHQNTYPRHSIPNFHDAMNLKTLYNNLTKAHTARPLTRSTPSPVLKSAPVKCAPTTDIKYFLRLLQQNSEEMRRNPSNLRGNQQFNNCTSNTKRVIPNNYHHNNSNYHNFHNNNHNNNHHNNNQSYHGNNNHQHTLIRSPMENLQPPIRLQQHDRRAENSKPVVSKSLSMPEKTPNGPPPVSFSPTNVSPNFSLHPFSPDNFSPSKVTNSPAHSSPPGAPLASQSPHSLPQQPLPQQPPPQQPPPTSLSEETQNNSSYGSHEDTLTYEPSEQLDQAFQPGYQPPSLQQSKIHKPSTNQPAPVTLQQNLPNVVHVTATSHPPMVLSQQSQTNLQDLALSPPPSSVSNSLERSRSSSGSYTESLAEKNNLYTDKTPPSIPSKPQHLTPSQTSIFHHQGAVPPQVNLQNRHNVPPRHQQDKTHMKPPHGDQLGGHVSEESIKMYLRNHLQHQPTAPGFHNPLHGSFHDYHSHGGDKGQRLDNRSPAHGIPPPGYNPIPFLNPQILNSYLQFRPGIIPPNMQPPHMPVSNPTRYRSPSPSEDESDEDPRQ